MSVLNRNFITFQQKTFYLIDVLFLSINYAILWFNFLLQVIKLFVKILDCLFKLMNSKSIFFWMGTVFGCYHHVLSRHILLRVYPASTRQLRQLWVSTRLRIILYRTPPLKNAIIYFWVAQWSLVVIVKFMINIINTPICFLNFLIWRLNYNFQIIKLLF